MWARKGGELFYMDASNALMAVPVETSGTPFRHGKPASVFETRYSGDFHHYDVTPDGHRFLMMKQGEPGDRHFIHACPRSGSQKVVAAART